MKILENDFNFNKRVHNCTQANACSNLVNVFLGVTRFSWIVHTSQEIRLIQPNLFLRVVNILGCSATVRSPRKGKRFCQN